MDGYVDLVTKTKGYLNRKERIAALNLKAARVWKLAYERALGWDPDPEGVAHKAMAEFLASHGAL